MRNRIVKGTLCQENWVVYPFTADPDIRRRRVAAGARIDASGAAALPCLNSHNSIDEPENTPPKLTGHAARRLFTVKENAARFINTVGLDRVGFLTLTFPESMLDHKEASRRWDSLNTNLLPLLFGHWQRVFERTKKGNVHYHVLVDCQRDIRTGFDFDLYFTALQMRKMRLPYRHIERQAFRTANADLRNFWQILRERLPAYGFGRHELLPIRTNIEAAAKYVGKYVSKDMNHFDQDKGVRRISYSQGQIRSSSNFAWHSEGSREWRRKVMVLAHFLGLEDMADLKTRFGPRWSRFLADTIIDIDQIILGTQRGEYALLEGELVDMKTGQVLF